MFRRPLALAALLCAHAVPTAHAQGWSTTPLRAPTPTPKDGLPTERGAFNQWLRAHKDSLTLVQARTARERLFVYISAEAKIRGGTLPAPGDTGAIGAFVLAAGLGDPGALLVTSQWTGAKPPYEVEHRGLKMSFEAPYLTAGGQDGQWRVCYPFFFMTEPVGLDATPGKVPAETVILSTLVSPDKSPAGASAAHIFIAAVPLADSARFVNDAIASVPLHAMGPTETPGAWYRGPDNARTPTVAVVKRLPKRVVLLLYTGERGTFETNRTHFETLAARLGTGACAP